MKSSVTDRGVLFWFVILACLSACGRGDTPDEYSLRVDRVGMGEYAADVALEFHGIGPFNVLIAVSDAESLRTRAAKDDRRRTIKYSVRYFDEAGALIREMKGVEIFEDHTPESIVDRVIVPLHLPVDEPIRAVIQFGVDPSFPDEENTIMWLSFEKPGRSI